MRLCREVRIFASTMKRVFADRRREQTALAVHDGGAHAQRSEIKADDSSHSLLAASRRMRVHLPIQILCCSLIHRSRDLRHVGSDMMLESLAANVLQQILKVRDLGDPCAPERLQRIICEPSFTDIAA